jgi:hypothetical protein
MDRDFEDRETPQDRDRSGWSFGAPGRIRTCNQRIMLTNYAFRRPFRVCGLDFLFTSRDVSAVKSLHLPALLSAWLGITILLSLGFPEFNRFYQIVG